MERCSVHEHWYVYFCFTINTLHSTTHKEPILISLFTCFRCSCSLKKPKELHSMRQVGFQSYCSPCRHSCLCTFQNLLCKCLKQHTPRYRVWHNLENCFKLTVRYWSARSAVCISWPNNKFCLNKSLLSGCPQIRRKSTKPSPTLLPQKYSKILAVTDWLHGNLS